MHSQRADEIPFEHPERFGEQQRIGHLYRHPVHDLAPEFLRDRRIEIGTGHSMFRPGWDGAARAGFGEP